MEVLVTLVRSPSRVLTLTWNIQGLEKNRKSVLRCGQSFFQAIYTSIYRRGVAIVCLKFFFVITDYVFNMSNEANCFMKISFMIRFMKLSS